MALRDSHGNQYLLLLKLGQKEYLEMLRKGKLYMNTLDYFTTLDSDPARADPYEGTDSIIQPRHIRDFIIDPNLHVGLVCSKHLREYRNLLHPAVCLREGRQHSTNARMTATSSS